MAAPESLRRGIFPISAPPREASSLPKRRVETTPGFPEQGKPPKTRKKLGTKARIALAGTALGVLGAGAYETYQNVPAVHQAVDSAFLDHIRGGSSSPEASVFDNRAKEIVITPNNSVQIPQEQYKAPPMIDINNPDAIVSTLPIKLNTSVNTPPRTLTIERQSGYLHVGGYRSINPAVEKSPDGRPKLIQEREVKVNDATIIKDGLIEGDEVALFFDENDLHDVTIERQGRINGNDGRTIEEEVFYIKAKGSNGDLIFVNIYASSIKLVKDLPPATMENVKLENGSDGFRLKTTKRPLMSGESIATKANSSKSKVFDGQLMTTISTRVTLPDGTIHAGGTEYLLSTANNKFSIVTK